MADQVLAYALTGDASGAKAAFADVGASIATTAKRVDEMAKSVQSMAGKLDKAASSARSVSNPVSDAESAFAKLERGLQSAATRIPGLDTGVSTLTSSMSALANPLVAIPAMLASAAVAGGGLALANADLIEHLGNLSITTGLSINELRSLREVTLQSGLDFDTAAKAASKMETNIGNNSTEMKKLHLTGGDVIEDMARVADQFRNAETQGEKNRIATTAFGKAWQDIAPLLEQGGDAIRKLRTDSNLSPEDIEKYKALDETSDKIAQSWREIKFAIGDAAAGPTNTLLSGLKAALDYLKETSALWTQLQTVGANTTATDADLRKQRVATGELLSIKGVMSNNGGIYGDRFMEEFRKLGKEQAQQVILGWAQAEAGGRFGASFQNQMINRMRDAWNEMPEPPAKKIPQPKLSAEEQAALDAALEKELEFRHKLQGEIAEMTADGDLKEMINLRNKFDSMLREHRKFGESVIAIESARDLAILDLEERQTLKHHAKLRSEYESLENERRKEFGAMLSEADNAYKNANGSSFYDWASVNPGSTEEDSASGEATRKKMPTNAYKLYDAVQKDADAEQKKHSEEAKKAAEELKKAYQNIGSYIAGGFSQNFTNAFMSIQSGSQSASSAIKNAFITSLESIESKLIEVTLKYAALSLIGSFVPEFGTSLGFFDFLTKEIGGHANGTLSSPGGLRFLGENGPESFRTPSGASGIATYGLYQVPSGTRVEKSESKSLGGSKEFHLHTTQSDPVQVAEQFRRIVREEVASYNSNDYRERRV